MSFIPPSEKAYPHPEGTLLLGFNKKANAFYITKVLRIDKVVMKPGEIKNIAGHKVKAPAEDFFLAVSVKWTDTIYPTKESAKEAVDRKGLAWKYMHIPMRPSGLMAEPGELVGHETVADEELEGYFQWKKAFDSGEAGVW
jgi:hypothetical protein